MPERSTPERSTPEGHGNKFSLMHPLHHPRLDTWGLGKRTRVWMADGGYVPIDEIEPGDHVLGVSFRVERDYLPRHEDPHHEANFVQIRRPYLVARKVTEMKEIQARPWQLTFGDENTQKMARRLVAGGDTQIVRFPISAKYTLTRRLVDCATAVENPRVDPQRMKGEQLDVKASQEHGEAIYRPSQFSGQTRGEMAITIPYEAYGGQMDMLKTDEHDYNRYLFSQVREVKPLAEKYPLYQIRVQPDTDPETGAPVRSNLIAQTPFRKGKRKTKVDADHLSRKRMTAGSWEEYMGDWDSFVENHQEVDEAPEANVKKVDYEADQQGQHYLAQREDMARELKQQYGLTGGFLNGGILLEVPSSVGDAVDDKSAAPAINYRFDA